MSRSRNLLRPRWKPTAADIELMRRRFPDTPTGLLAQVFGVAYHQVARLALKLGLRKSEAFFASPASGRTTGAIGGSTRFQKGHVPWTKGKRGLRLSPRTEFKPGGRPQNWRPIGAFRLLRNPSVSYLQIKLTDTGYTPRDWVMYHRYVWEQANGPIPEGHVVVFKPGRFSNDPEQITVDALELVSLREHMLRYSLHNYGPEIAGAIILRGAITRQINKKARQT